MCALLTSTKRHQHDIETLRKISINFNHAGCAEAIVGLLASKHTRIADFAARLGTQMMVVSPLEILSESVYDSSLSHPRECGSGIQVCACKRNA